MNPKAKHSGDNQDAKTRNAPLKFKHSQRRGVQTHAQLMQDLNRQSIENIKSVIL
jgi:hypothetical protein